MIRTASVLRSIRQGLLICNRQGRIVYFNDAYGAFIGKKLEDVAGLPIRSVRPGSIVPQVLKSGKKRENIFRTEGNQEYFVNVYPILEDQELTGTVSIVTAIDREKLKSRPQRTLRERLKEFERKEIEEALFLYGDDTEGKKKAAKELGISLATLYNKLQF